MKVQHGQTRDFKLMWEYILIKHCQEPLIIWFIGTLRSTKASNRASSIAFLRKFDFYYGNLITCGGRYGQTDTSLNIFRRNLVEKRLKIVPEN